MHPKRTSFLDDKTDTARLNPLLLPVAGLGASSAQSVRFALVRLGDTKLKNQPVNDDFLVFMLPDLVYTHQRDVFAEIVKHLYGEEKNCEGSNPTSKSMINCAYLLMIKLAPYIENYPLKVDAFGDVDLPATNEAYKQALQEVRRWFETNPAYRLKDDVY